MDPSRRITQRRRSNPHQLEPTHHTHAQIRSNRPHPRRLPHHDLAAEAATPVFQRIAKRTELPHIRFHDLRHTHASLLVADGVPIKVVSERLGHAHPGFTMATYQHLLPGMGATAANRFADIINR